MSTFQKVRVLPAVDYNLLLDYLWSAEGRMFFTARQKRPLKTYAWRFAVISHENIREITKPIASLVGGKFAPHLAGGVGWRGEMSVDELGEVVTIDQMIELVAEGLTKIALPLLIPYWENTPMPVGRRSSLELFIHEGKDRVSLFYM